MIEVLQDMPVGVAGIHVSGKVTGQEITEFKAGFGTLIQHHSAFKRVAIVTDKGWVAHTVHAVGWMVPGELEVFGLEDLERAKQWAAD